MIELKNVQYQYHYDNFAVIKNATFTLSEPVSTVACDIQSGKTTFCRLFTELKYNGSILLDGTELSQIPPSQREILVLSSVPTFFNHRSVMFNIAYPLKVRKIPKESAKNIVLQVAQKLNLTDLLNKKICKLTLPQQRLVALARGLTVSRKYVFFDDFFFEGELSPTQVFNLFPSAQKIVLTGDTNKLFGQVVVMDGGTNVFQGDAVSAKQYIDSQLKWLYNSTPKDILSD